MNLLDQSLTRSRLHESFESYESVLYPLPRLDSIEAASMNPVLAAVYLKKTLERIRRIQLIRAI